MPGMFAVQVYMLEDCSVPGDVFETFAVLFHTAATAYMRTQHALVVNACLGFIASG